MSSGDVIRRIVGWQLTQGNVVKLLGPRDAEKEFGPRIYNGNRPEGLVPIFEGDAAARLHSAA